MEVDLHRWTNLRKHYRLDLAVREAHEELRERTFYHDFAKRFSEGQMQRLANYILTLNMPNAQDYGSVAQLLQSNGFVQSSINDMAMITMEVEFYEQDFDDYHNLVECLEVEFEILKLIHSGCCWFLYKDHHWSIEPENKARVSHFLHKMFLVQKLQTKIRIFQEKFWRIADKVAKIERGLQANRSLDRLPQLAGHIRKGVVSEIMEPIILSHKFDMQPFKQKLEIVDARFQILEQCLRERELLEILNGMRMRVIFTLPSMIFFRYYISTSAKASFTQQLLLYYLINANPNIDGEGIKDYQIELFNWLVHLANSKFNVAWYLPFVLDCLDLSRYDKFKME